MWVDVEGGERLLLGSVDWAAVSVGILVVEMRFNDATTNQAIYALLRGAGFELVRSLAVWTYNIFDNVFLRAEHFLAPNATRMPEAVGALLRAQRRNAPQGANRKLLRGRVGCEKYTVEAPLTTLWCVPRNATC